jgi:hypothetical protein
MKWWDASLRMFDGKRLRQLLEQLSGSAWLGHVSLNTTNVYAEVDLEMKAKALATCEIKTDKVQKHWRGQAGLLRLLRLLQAL